MLLFHYLKSIGSVRFEGGEPLGQMQHNKLGNTTVALIMSDSPLPDHYYATMPAFRSGAIIEVRPPIQQHY